MGIDISHYRAVIGSQSPKSFFFSRLNFLTTADLLYYYFLLSVVNFLFLPHVLLTLLSLPSRASLNKATTLPRIYYFRHPSNPFFMSWLFIFASLNKTLLLRAGVEINPGPLPPRLSFATFNIDSLLARDGCKLPLIEGIDSVYKFDIFGICESYLTPAITNSKLIIDGFSPDPIRADSPTEGRPRGGVCLFYKDHVPLKHRPDLEVLSECIVCEITIKKKKILYTSLPIA